MKTSIYSRQGFHPDTIKRAVWLYFRFNLSFRDVEELMIEPGVDISYETIGTESRRSVSPDQHAVTATPDPPNPYDTRLPTMAPESRFLLDEAVKALEMR